MRVVSNDIIDSLFYPFIMLLIRLAIIIALAPLAAVFLVIMNLVTFFKTSSALKDTKNTYAAERFESAGTDVFRIPISCTSIFGGYEFEEC